MLQLWRPTAWMAPGGLRFASTKTRTSRSKNPVMRKGGHRTEIRRRATDQEVEWIRQLDKAPPVLTAAPEPDLKLRPLHERYQQVMGSKDTMAQEHRSPEQLSIEEVLSPTFQGILQDVAFGPFGNVQIVHGDIYEQVVDAMLVPMTGNFLPYRGFGLEVLELGGPGLVKAAFQAVRDKTQVQIGDVIWISTESAALTLPLKAKRIGFVIMPHFWQGSAVEAARRLRFVMKRTFEACQMESGISTVALPHLSCGLYGYEPGNAAQTMMEEVVEGLMQLDDVEPTYNLRQVVFCDKSIPHLTALKESLEKMALLWLPEQRVLPAPVFFSRKHARLMALPRALRIDKYKFKKYSGIARNRKTLWQSTKLPFVWRPSIVEQPPPLLVRKATGVVADASQQLPARPHYFRGVTHRLFPVPRSGFHGLRIDGSGKFTGVNQQPRVREVTNPRQ